jgi:malonyl-CoA O-methyltransferase
VTSPADPFRLDARSVRRSFDRAADGYDAAAALQREVGQRMAERLVLVKLRPALILDAGCGTGDALAELSARYPDAQVVGVDFAHAMLVAARRRVATATATVRSLPEGLIESRAPRREPALVCGDASRLPLATASVDLVWSNLTLEWSNDPASVFAEFHRVLRVGGLLMFATLGPDTLKELRAAFAAVDRATTHVGRFIDMHDLGDMLVHEGFADPVMDAERLTLTYTDATAMMRELKATGSHNATVGRSRGLTGRVRWSRVLAALERFRRDGRLPATCEVVYGHAWKPEPRFADDGRAIVQFRSRR